MTVRPPKTRKRRQQRHGTRDGLYWQILRCIAQQTSRYGILHTILAGITVFYTLYWQIFQYSLLHNVLVAILIYYTQHSLILQYITHCSRMWSLALIIGCSSVVCPPETVPATMTSLRGSGHPSNTRVLQANSGLSFHPQIGCSSKMTIPEKHQDGTSRATREPSVSHAHLL